ncbi:MAG: hypothetical protein LPK09_11455 [Hymenobacteraceae bacterium]|nr:hypothetical protein [Hymenobacteraceae bacterium]
MKKKLFLPVSVLLATSLMFYFYSGAAGLAGCKLEVHDTRITCDDFFKIAYAKDSGEEDMAAAKPQSSQQNEAQRASIPDRALRLIDSFGKLVMVI